MTRLAKVAILGALGLLWLAIGGFDWIGPAAIVSRADAVMVGFMFFGLAVLAAPEAKDS